MYKLVCTFNVLKQKTGEDEMKWIVMVLLLTSGCATLGLQDINLPKQVLTYYDKNTWQISNDRMTGTAFHVSPVLLITNAHVVVPKDVNEFGHKMVVPPTQFVLTKEDREGEVALSIVSIDEDLDLALIRCPLCPEEGELAPYVLSDKVFDKGTRAFGGGYGLGLFSIHTGFLQSREDDYMYSDVPKAPGDSGSPLIVMENNIAHVVGVRIAVANMGTHPVWHKGRSIPISVVKEWLSQL